jgi:ABC-2 type transport system ATP-binding protein
MSAAITVIGLRKRYGPTAALDGMTFEVVPGRVTGFVGPNGAGKSTTMRVILGLDRADAGTALVGGRPYPSYARPMCALGALLDAGALHPARAGRGHLLWLARSQGLSTRRVDEVLALVGLATVGKRRAGGYSLGMRQRLGIAAALLGDPAALMFDEPLNGMDPEGIVWMRALLRSLAAEGRAVLVSSHLMSEVEGTADHLLIAGRGRIIADTPTADLLAAAAGDRVTVRTSMPAAAAAALRDAGGSVAPQGADVVAVTGLAAGDAVAALSRAGVAFSEVTAARVTLEQAYLELTRDEIDFRGQPAHTRAHARETSR